MTHYCFGDLLFSMSEPGSECFFFFSDMAFFHVNADRFTSLFRKLY